MPEHPEKSALLAVHRARIAALVAADVETLDRHVSDDLIYTSPTGRTQGKRQIIAGLTGGTVRVEQMETDQTEVRLYRDAAVVTYRARTVMHDGADIVTGLIRSTATYVKENGQWRLVAQHQCRIE